MGLEDDFDNSVAALMQTAERVEQEFLGSAQVEKDLQRRLSDLIDRNYEDEPSEPRFLEVSRETLDNIRRKIDQFETRWSEGLHQEQARTELEKVKNRLKEVLGNQIYFGIIEETSL